MWNNWLVKWAVGFAVALGGLNFGCSMLFVWLFG